MGVDSATSRSRRRAPASTRVKALQRDPGVPTRLRDTGLDCALLPAIAADTLRDRGLFFNPRRTENAEPIVDILEQAW
jgi:alcohol dehydrogenase